MVVEAVTIRFGGEDRLYYPGELLNGYCEIVIANERTVLTVVSVKIHGVTKVSWSECLTKTTGHKHTIWYIDSVTIFSKKADIFIQNEFLEPGRHNLPFAFQLKPNLPSSFDGSYGSIRYWLEATAKSPSFSTKAFASFKMLQPIDISYSSRLSLPVEASQSAVIRYYFYKEGSVAAKIKTDRSAYCSGDIVQFTGSFENNSRRKLLTCVKLVQKQIISTRGGQTKVHATYFSLEPVEVNGGPIFIRKRSTLLWSGEGYRLPDVIAPSSKCSVLQVSYHLEVGLTISGKKTAALNVKLPIIIGTPATRKYFVVENTSSSSSIVNYCQQEELKNYCCNNINSNNHNNNNEELLLLPNVPINPSMITTSHHHHLLEAPPSYQETLLAINQLSSVE